MEVHHYMYFLRIVSKDYDFLEEVMTMMYSPLHFYCFVIDSRATPKFERLVRTLGECILNIIVPRGTYNTSTAHGTFVALNACYIGMEKFPWKHSIITEENEMPIHSIHYIADNARRLGDAARIGRVTISEEHARILGKDLSKASKRDQEYIKRAVCTWLTSRRFPLTLPRSFQPVLFRFLAQQDFENCEPLSPTFDKNVALDVCHTERFDQRGNCIVGMEDYDESTLQFNTLYETKGSERNLPSVFQEVEVPLRESRPVLRSWHHSVRERVRLPSHLQERLRRRVLHLTMT
ncbi:hypothetical protein Y032_0012g1715 [Ancylostoma ceylanicum]|uniref:Core-2/I-Branching enzyme n=1 Tax=Ancylostoma ceylanicum TaxID=53326 RepID=A0A016VBV5_9BILA|nr:hypothetical protein Y032_0012g1715 [Ancylostoma ceylanicum]